jgi:FeS assembly SUF system protein
MDSVTKTLLEAKVIEVLESCFDPEIPVNIYELGLVYAIHIGDEGDLQIQMTLTTPHCPVATSLPGEVQSKLSAIPNVRSVNVDLVWDPPWDPGKMSESARLQLGFL